MIKPGGAALRKMQWLAMAWLPFALASCFEVREEIGINYDGSGTYELRMDFSQEKENLKAITLASEQDASVFGETGNPIEQYDSLLQAHALHLNSLDGIYNAAPIVAKENFIFGFRFDFISCKALNQALGHIQYAVDAEEAPQYFGYNYKGKFKQNGAGYLLGLFGGIPMQGDSSQHANENRLIADSALFCSTIRAGGEIKKYSNVEASLDKTRYLLTLKMTLRKLVDQAHQIKNTLKFK